MEENDGQNRTPKSPPDDQPKAKKYRPRRWMRAFLSVLSDTGIVRTACEAAKIARSAAYEAREKDGIFAQAWDDAREMAADLLVEEARRRAYIGDLEPVGFHKGVPGAYVRRYSDTLLIFLIKGARPNEYRDNVKAEIEGNLGLHVIEAPMKLGRDEWTQAAQNYREQRPASQGGTSGPSERDNPE